MRVIKNMVWNGDFFVAKLSDGTKAVIKCGDKFFQVGVDYDAACEKKRRLKALQEALKQG